MNEILQRMIDGNFSELDGLKVDASIPLSEHLVNEFVAAALQGNRRITNCYIAIHGDNRFVVNLKTPLWPLSIKLKLQLDRSVDIINGPKIKALLMNFSLAGKLGAALKALPQGITMQHDKVIIDLDSFPMPQDQRKWLPLIKAVEVSTEEAKINLEIKIQID